MALPDVGRNVFVLVNGAALQARPVGGPRWILSERPVPGFVKQTSNGTPGAPSWVFGPENSDGARTTFTPMGTTPAGNAPDAMRMTGLSGGRVGGCAAGRGWTLPPSWKPNGIWKVIGVRPFTLAEI